MKKIHISFARDLKNTEFKTLFGEVAIRLANINIAHPIIQKSISTIQQRNEDLINLRIGSLKHNLTAVINEKIKTRTTYLSSLRMSIGAAMTTCLPEHREAGRILSIWLDPYKKNLFKPTINAQSHLVRCMMDDRKITPEIKEAVTLLNLDMICDAIIALTAEIDNHLLQRSQETTLYSMKVNGLREAAYKELKALVNIIPSVYYVTDTTAEEKEDIVALNNSLNYIITGIRGIFRARRTKSKNREIEAAIKELIEAEEADNRIEKKQVAPANGSEQTNNEPDAKNTSPSSTEVSSEPTSTLLTLMHSEWTKDDTDEYEERVDKRVVKGKSNDKMKDDCIE